MATLEEQIAEYQAKTGSVGTSGSGDVEVLQHLFLQV